MKPLREIVEGPFAEWLGDDDWTPWFAFLSALRAEPMSKRERRLYRECTGRTELPSKPFGEAWVVVGRRGRKSAIAAVLGCYFAIYKKWPRAAGETVRVLVVAVSKEQAKIVRGYCEAILESRPGLRRLIKATDADSITLTNGIQIQCVANSFRSIRGPTVVCAIFEEIAFWFDERYANPDKEVLRAIRPSMLTVPGALLLGISSPYAKRGLLYEKYRKHFGRDGSKVLIWQADTQTMNPQVDAEIIEEAYEEDPVAASAEYGAEFRTDISSFVGREAVEACIDAGTLERLREPGNQYKAFCDPSGGRNDSMTLAVGHRDNDVAVLDCLREIKAPFSPEEAVAEFSHVLKSYGVTALIGDRYAGAWPVEAFSKHGITYDQAAKPKSDLYRDFLPQINSRKVWLLDSPRLVNQLAGLERRTARGGKDSVDHAPGAKDDLANSVAGVAVSLAATDLDYDETLSWVGGDDSEWRAGRLHRHILLNSGGYR